MAAQEAGLDKEFVSDINTNSPAILHDLYEARLSQRFDNMEVEDLKDTEYFPCINECILKHLMKYISKLWLQFVDFR